SVMNPLTSPEQAKNPMPQVSMTVLKISWFVWMLIPCILVYSTSINMPMVVGATGPRQILPTILIFLMNLIYLCPLVKRSFQNHNLKWMFNVQRTFLLLSLLSALQMVSVILYCQRESNGIGVVSCVKPLF